MNQLMLRGRIQIEDMKFYHIEGGFGKDQRSMLAKDIARIHGRELKTINQAINMNRKRFRDGIDILDVKGTEFEVNLIDHGAITQNAANRSQNIYILSERGYSKLLKILEDDLAWEQYEKLVDGYFNMRQVMKDNKISLIKQKEIEAKFNNSLVRKANVLRKIAEDPSTPKEYREVLNAKIVEILTGQQLLPLPRTERTYTAGDIAKELGVSANLVGRVANANGLKTEEYGLYVWDKSPYSDKQVQTWRYNEKGRAKLIELFSE